MGLFDELARKYEGIPQENWRVVISMNKEHDKKTVLQKICLLSGKRTRRKKQIKKAQFSLGLFYIFNPAATYFPMTSQS
jgi:hypothetical protein